MPAVSKRKREHLDQGQAGSGPPGPSYSHAANFEAQYLHHDEGDLGLAEALAQHNSNDMPSSAPSHETNGQSATDTANAALHFGLSSGHQGSHFLEQTPVDNTEAAPEPSFDLESPRPTTIPSYTVEPLKSPPNAESASPIRPPGAGSMSPPETSPKDSSKHKVGTEEWARMRRNNHKEVERRRRETINEGINELAKIIPGAEKNKGGILSRAVMYIAELKEHQSEMEQKNNLEKMMFEQAIAEMSSTGDKLKAEVRRLEKEVEGWRRKAEGS